MNQLTKYDAARYALSVAVEVDEVKDIRDKAEAMAAYARQAKDTELVQWATEIKVRAERRAGQMLSEMPKAKGEILRGNTLVPRGSDVKTLADIGITKNESSRWQKLAAVSDSQFEHAVAAAKEVAGEVTTAAMLRAAKADEPKQDKPKSQDNKAPASELIIVDECHQIESDDQMIDRLSREKMELLDRLQTLLVDDQAKKLNDQQTEIYSLRGRVQQMLGENKANADKLNYFSDLLHKLRKIYGVDTHKEILEAAQAQMA